MKESLSHLPPNKQMQLAKLVSYILEEVPETGMIILYGSYARGTYIEYDQRVEFGLRTCFGSDFDILVLISEESTESAELRLERACRKFSGNSFFTLLPTVQYLLLHIDAFNKMLTEGYYFFDDVEKEGIILHNSGNYKIAPAPPLNKQQMLKLSLEYYKDKYERAESFLKGAKFYNDNCDYRMASFMLHQAVENYCLAIILSANLYAPKEHNIVRLIDEAVKIAPAVAQIFNASTIDESRILQLLQNAYVQSRYNKDFLVTGKDIDILLLRNRQLQADSRQICREIIENHRQRAANDNTRTDSISTK